MFFNLCFLSGAQDPDRPPQQGPDPVLPGRLLSGGHDVHLEEGKQGAAAQRLRVGKQVQLLFWSDAVSVVAVAVSSSSNFFYFKVDKNG